VTRTVTELKLRGILDSRARVTVEAELTINGTHTGLGSAPRAIAPGRLERRRGPDVTLGSVESPALRQAFCGHDINGQRDCDALLDEIGSVGEAGADLTLAVSLAYARAVAASQAKPLYRYLSGLLNGLMDTVPKLPGLMVNVFSGGIHLDGPTAGFQQVMVLPATGTLIDDIRLASDVFAAAQRMTEQRFGQVGLSASSGLLVPLDSVGQLELAASAIVAAGGSTACTLGVDVAAEHLAAGPGRYRFGSQELDSTAFARRLAEFATRYPLSYIEDPFDPADIAGWRQLRSMVTMAISLVGDDLFATDAERIDADLADGVLLKLSQAGTVTATLRAAAAARSAGMLIAVSHRSGETEDTAMCDLAAAVGADLIKVGGPRRGDRLAKYNQLLRLAEHVDGWRSPDPSMTELKGTP
jgi:enolase